MRRREKELEDLLAAKTEELGAAQREIEKLKVEAQELKKRFEERDAYALKLQTRESDVVAAFAEIQNTRNKKLKEAEEEASQMNENARRIVERAQYDADRIKNEAIEAANKTKADAQGKAEEVLQKANENAAEIESKTNALHAESEEENRKMKLQLASIAHQCKAYISTLENSVARLQGIGWIEEGSAEGEENAVQEKAPVLQDEIQTEEEQTEAPAVKIDTPERYDDPAELMKNIYAIENRDIPVKEENEVEAPSGEPDHVWTVDEIVDSVIDDGKGSEDDYLEKLIEEILQ